MTTPSEEEARAAAIAALEWFDSINGDRENGRVLIEYHVLAALASRVSTPPSEDVRHALEAAALRAERGYLYGETCDDIARDIRAMAVPAVPVLPTEPARQVRECVICGEKVTVSNATKEWEERHRQCKGRGPFDDISRLVPAPTEPEPHPAHSGHEFGGGYARAAALAAGDPDWINATGGTRPTEPEEKR